MTRRRGLALGVAVFATASVVGVQYARAELAERLLSLAAPLGKFVELAGPELTLELNGATLRVSTSTIPGDVASALDRFDAICADSAPRLAAALRQAAAPHSARRGGVSRGTRSGLPRLDSGDAAAPRGTRSGLLRVDAGEAGAALCLAQADDSDLAGLVKRAAHVAQSGDLAQLGQLRYLSVRSVDARASQLVLVRADGPLPLEAMFPSHSDAPGRDFAALPRPSLGRRMLSAHVSGSASGLVAYRVPGTPDAALAAYVAELARQGYRELPIPGAPGITSVLRGRECFVLHALSLDGECAIGAVALPLTAAVGRDDFDGEAGRHVD